MRRAKVTLAVVLLSLIGYALLNRQTNFPRAQEEQAVANPCCGEGSA